MTATRTPRSNRFQLAKQQLCSCITLFGTFLTHCYTTTTSNFTFCQGQEHKKTTSFLFEILNCGGGGEDRGVTISRLPYVFVPLFPDSRRLLCFSRYHVNHPVWLPIHILMGSALALSKIKNWVVNRATPHFPVRSLKWHSLDTSRANKCWAVKRALHSSFNLWCRVGLARALFPCLRCAWRPAKFSFLQTGNPIFFLEFQATMLNFYMC